MVGKAVLQTREYRVGGQVFAALHHRFFTVEQGLQVGDGSVQRFDRRCGFFEGAGHLLTFDQLGIDALGQVLTVGVMLIWRPMLISFFMLLSCA